jgi:hypothetical protein
MKPIQIPVQDRHSGWDGTTGVQCSCGGIIEWAEAAYVPGTRACRSCLAMYQVRGDGADRRLVPQGVTGSGVIGDVGPEDEVYYVPENLYPGWHQ